MSEIAVVDRRKFIGGSDVAVILGLSPWRTPVELWEEKRRPRGDQPEKRVFVRGKRWEAVVAEMLTERLQADGHAVEVVAANARYLDTEHDFMACEIDYELRLDGEDEITNCELKTVHPFKAREWGENESDELPVHYTAQAMYGLGITGRRRCIVAPLFGADEIRTYTIERDDETIAAMRARVVEFWTQHVLTGNPPAPIVLRDLDVLHPKDGEAPALYADESLTHALLRMRAIDREIKARTAEYEALEFEVKRAMRDCASIVVGEGKEAATWKARSYSYLDQSGLKEAHPDIAKQFTRKAESRVFTLKPFSTEGIL